MKDTINANDINWRNIEFGIAKFKCFCCGKEVDIPLTYKLFGHQYMIPLSSFKEFKTDSVHICDDNTAGGLIFQSLALKEGAKFLVPIGSTKEKYFGSPQILTSMYVDVSKLMKKEEENEV